MRLDLTDIIKCRRLTLSESSAKSVQLRMATLNNIIADVAEVCSKEFDFPISELIVTPEFMMYEAPFNAVGVVKRKKVLIAGLDRPEFFHEEKALNRQELLAYKAWRQYMYSGIKSMNVVAGRVGASKKHNGLLKYYYFKLDLLYEDINGVHYNRAANFPTRS